MKLWSLVMLLALSLGATLPLAHAQTDYTPIFEEGECPFPDVPDVTCGTLIVPEDRTDPTGTQVELAVAIIAAENANPLPDPIIYLEGGPGGSALFAVEDFLTHPMRRNRDLILIDQRGNGFSYPSLNCYELEELEEEDPTLACYERLLDEGINLSAYTSAQNAADIEDLRLALGYDEWNLYGISYGTRLALNIMRDYPEGLRAVVIDSVWPPDADFYAESTVNTLNAFNHLFSECAADATCSEAYPDLEEDFYALVDSLNEDPVTFEYDDGYDVYDFELYGDDVADALFHGLYVSEAIPMMPYGLDLLAYAESDEDYTYGYDIISGYWTPETWEEGEILPAETVMESDEVLAYLDEYGDVSDSEGMYLSVNCTEEHPFDDADSGYITVEDAPAALQPWLNSSIEVGILDCETWLVDPTDAIEDEAVASDVPTLIISGSFDPITPPIYGDQTLENLSNGQHLVFANAGHGISGSPGCAADIATDFLNDPSASLETSCMADEAEITWYTE